MIYGTNGPVYVSGCFTLDGARSVRLLGILGVVAWEVVEPDEPAPYVQTDGEHGWAIRVVQMLDRKAGAWWHGSAP